MPGHKSSLAIVSTHPIQYQVPIYRTLAEDNELNLQVYYASDFSVRGEVDPGFGVPVAWDIPLLDGYPHTFLLNRSRRQKFDSFWSFNCPDILREFAPGHFDAVLINAYSSLLYLQAVYAARRAGIAVMIRAETTDVAQPRPVWKQSLRRWLLSRLYHHCDSCLPIGQNSRAHYLAHGVSEDRLVFSPYCVDNAFFKAEAGRWAGAREATRQELGFGPDELVVLFAGKLIPKKDPWILARAVQSVAGAVSILWMGDGELRSGLENFCTHQLGHPFAFVGFQNQSQVGKYYTAADLLVLPSAYGETWGLVVNEAMNFGLPVIVSDQVGCAPDLVIPGQTGEIFTSRQVDRLVEAILKFVIHTDRCQQQGNAARQQVAKYSIQQAADGIKQALLKIVDNKH